MATLSQHTGLSMFAPPNPNGMDGPPPPYQYPHHYHQQPAPRQRTAIACRYCRRRKIRCSGFETSHDGRCANCMRFNQECIFTPVSSQAQAFVPAHVHSMSGARPVQLFGPQGQPLPASYDYQQTTPNPSAPIYVPSDHDPEDQHGRGLPPLRADAGGNPPPFVRRGSNGEMYTSPLTYCQPTSPSSHLPPPHHAYSPPPVNYGQSAPPPPNSSSAQGGYNNSEYGPPPQRADSPGSYGSQNSEHRDHPSVSPTPQSFHPPMVRPSSAGPHGAMHAMQLIDPPQHTHQQRSAADGDMLSRLNSRTGF